MCPIYSPLTEGREYVSLSSALSPWMARHVRGSERWTSPTFLFPPSVRKPDWILYCNLSYVTPAMLSMWRDKSMVRDQLPPSCTFSPIWWTSFWWFSYLSLTIPFFSQKSVFKRKYASQMTFPDIKLTANIAYRARWLNWLRSILQLSDYAKRIFLLVFPISWYGRVREEHFLPFSLHIPIGAVAQSLLQNWSFLRLSHIFIGFIPIS